MIYLPALLAQDLSIGFFPVVPPEPLLHFLQQPDFIFVACRIGKSLDGPFIMELFIFKPAGEFWHLVVRYQPYACSRAFNFKLFHISCPPKALAASALVYKGKIRGFISIAFHFCVKPAGHPETLFRSAGLLEESLYF